MFIFTTWGTIEKFAQHMTEGIKLSFSIFVVGMYSVLWTLIVNNGELVKASTSVKLVVIQSVSLNRQQLVFAEWAQEQLETDHYYHKKIIFSDEAHFYVNGYVNKQNCCIW